MESFENQLHQDLHQFLLSMKEVDEHLPECTDIEDVWEPIAKAYIPDGVKEFNDDDKKKVNSTIYVNNTAVEAECDKCGTRYSLFQVGHPLNAPEAASEGS